MKTTIARWQTKGNDWLELHRDTLSDGKAWYHYSGSGCGGGINAKSDDEAIAAMEYPWGHPNGTGPATVLKSDRPSLRRTL